MKNLNITLIALLCVFQVALVGCESTTTTSKSAGQSVDDKKIKGEAKSAIRKDSILRVADIKVDSYMGTVQLTGFVDHQEQKDHATEVIQRIPDVKGLRNNIVVKGSSYQEPAGSQPNR